MRTRTAAALAVLAAVLAGARAGAPVAPNERRGASRDIGTPGALFARFIPTFGAVQATEVRVGVPGGADAAPVDLTHSAVTADGAYMTARGQVRGRAGSDFMMKGTAGEMYGWMTFADDGGSAVEFTTTPDGTVAAAEVPLDKIKPVCEFLEAKHGGDAHEPAAAGRGVDELAAAAHEVGYSGQDIRRLQSAPEMGAVMLLDFDQYFVNKQASDDVSRYSKTHFFQTWQGVAAGLSMFDINVVTDHDVYYRASIARRGRACFIDQDGRSNAASNSFGSDGCGAWNYRLRDGYTQARIALHEIGHMFGVAHDGVVVNGVRDEYSRGLAEFRWVPVMGNIYFGDAWGGEALYQWSRGEYTGATNTQDDLALIGRYVPRRADDIGTTPLRVGSGGAVSAGVNRGKISDRTDTDRFAFSVGAGGGRVTLRVDRAEYYGGAMLDVAAVLQDTAGRVYAQSNPKAVRGAAVDVAVPAGNYVLVVRGGAEGSPSYGFSNYASLGNYAISGSVTGASTPPPATPPPTPPPSTPTPTPPPTPPATPPPTPPPTPVPTPPPTGTVALSLAQDAGREVVATAGTISDGYARYPNDQDRWVAVLGRNCRVEWTHFDVQNSKECQRDYVELRAGGDVTRYCGHSLPPARTLAGTERFSVALSSDRRKAASGFDLKFACEAPAVALALAADNGRTVTAASGTITDGYAAYPINTEVAVTVVGRNCRLTWTAFDLEVSENCVWDYVEVRGGGGVQRYCGGQVPAAQTLDGTDQFSVVLHSDASVGGAGFDLAFACQ